MAPDEPIEWQEIIDWDQDIEILHGQLYIANCEDEGNTLKPHLSEKKTVIVLKTLVFERAWAPGLVHPT